MIGVLFPNINYLCPQELRIKTTNVSEGIFVLQYNYLCAGLINIHAFVCVFKMNFFKKFFQELYESVKWFGSRSGPLVYVGPDLGPNCVQRLSTDDKCHR